jgi:xanthine dehydrogenase accessory factor
MAGLHTAGASNGRRPLALVKGAGDLASGVAIRLHRAGFSVLMTEVARPTAVRRTVAFAEAVYERRVRVEGIEGVLAGEVGEAMDLLGEGKIAVLVDPQALVRRRVAPMLLVDAILAKHNVGTSVEDAPAVVALGPGYTAGVDAHAVVETKRGHSLGRVIWSGTALADTGIPGDVDGFAEERVLRAPVAGRFETARTIGTRLEPSDVVGYVDGRPVLTTIPGLLRGLLHSGLDVTVGFKLADVDPRSSVESCFTVSDKALAVAGGVLEAACHLLGGVSFARCDAGIDR